MIRMMIDLSILENETLVNLLTVLLMLLGSFALGYLFRLFLNAGLQQRLDSRENTIRELREDLVQAEIKAKNQEPIQKFEERIAILNRSNDLLQRDLEFSNNERAKLKIQLANIQNEQTEQTERTESTPMAKPLETDLAQSLIRNIEDKPSSTKIELDPLRKIEGIGPKIEEILHKHGILTFKILSNTDINRLRDIVHGANPAYKVHDPTTWPDQARLAHQGKWESLELLQSQLKGGKKL